MKKILALLAAGALAAALALGAAGCTSGNTADPGADPIDLDSMTDVQKATELVKGTLQLHYTGAPNDYLVALMGTQLWDQEQLNMMDADILAFCMYCGLPAADLDAQATEAIRALLKEEFTHVKYRVGDAVPEAGAFLVPVTVEPLDVMGLVGSLDWMELFDAYPDDVAAYGQQAAVTKLAEGAVALVRDKLPMASNLDPKTIVVKVLIDGDYWSIDTEALADITADGIIKYHYPDAS